MVVTAKLYDEIKADFFKRHDYDYKIQTSSMDEYGVYHKEYIFEDGSIWYEVYGPEYIKQTIEVGLVNVEVEVKMFRTEFFSSENASSMYFYEKF